MTIKYKPASQFWAELQRYESLRGEYDPVEEAMRDIFGDDYEPQKD